MSFNKALFFTGILTLTLSACANKPVQEDNTTVPEMSVTMPQEIPTDSIDEAPAAKPTKAKKSKKKAKKKS